MNSKLPNTLDLPSFRRTAIGFDSLLDQLGNHVRTGATYPPYNVAEIDENNYRISIAVAGFSMDNLEVTKDGNTLTIVGNSPSVNEDVHYIHKGLGTRSFKRSFTLANHVEVESATLELGVLHIALKRIVPEELLPKKIEILSKD